MGKSFRILKEYGGILALILLVVFGFRYFADIQALNNDIGEQALDLQAIKTEIQDKALELDAKIEALEARFAKLSKEGIIEKTDFSDISSEVLGFTVALLDKDGNAVGTGFFVTESGHVATAGHVAGALGEDARVKTAAGGIYRAKILARDDNSDIAILKTDARTPDFADLGYFKNIEVGDEIGFTGFAPSVAAKSALVHKGVVSGKWRSSSGVNTLTVNAFINKGNSGGPLFSAATGRVVGIISARERDVSSDRFIQLPPDYSPSVMLGSVDPFKLSIDLYNESLKNLGDISQIGIGIAYPADAIIKMLNEL